MCTDSDLAFCNSYEDGTNTNREPRQAYKTAEVGHSQLWAQSWVMRAYVLQDRTGNGFHIKFSIGLFHLLKIHPHRRATLGSPSRHQLILQKTLKTLIDFENLPSRHIKVVSDPPDMNKFG